MFLLNGTQINRIYKSNPEYLLATPTLQAIENSDYKGADVAENINHDYWVNLPSGNNFACYELTMRMTESGSLAQEWACRGYIGVRPAFYLNLENYDDGYYSNDYDPTGQIEFYSNSSVDTNSL